MKITGSVTSRDSLASSVLACLDEAVLATDVDARVVLMNRAAEELTGWTQAEAAGRHLAEVFRPVDARTGRTEGWLLGGAQELGHAARGDVETMLLRRSGEGIRIEGGAKPLRNQDGLSVGTVVVFRGVGQRKAGPTEPRNGFPGDHIDAEALFRLFLEHCPASSWIMDDEGRFEYISPTYRRMFRIPEGDFVGKTVFDLYPARVAGLYLESTKEVSRTGRPVEVRQSGCRGDGTPAEFLVYKFPLARPGKSVVCGMAVDITELKQWEDEVERLNEQLTRRVQELQTILDTVPVGVLVAHDPLCKRITVNRVLADLVGMPPGENISKSRDNSPQSLPFKVLKDGIELRSPELPMQRAGARGTDIDGEVLQIVRDDGRRITVMENARPVREESGAVVGVVGSCVDITALHEAEERLREADRRKDEFLGMLAHELRNPLAAITSATQLLGLDADSLSWASEVIDRQAQLLARIIDDLLDVSRITRGKIELKKENVDASRIIVRAVESVRRLIEERGHELAALSYRPGTLLIHADEVRLEQVFVSLLTNAVKFTPIGGRIWLSAANDGGTVSVSVRDNGNGIPPDRIAEMFELFAQGEDSLARSEGGLGIGLTLVRSLVELHGGSVEARSDGPGKGSEFIVHVPAAQQVPEAGPRGRRVLIVDDNLDMARSMARLVSLMGHDVRVAGSGPDALEMAKAYRAQVVLLDIGLPGMDGYEVARRLRAEEGTRNVRIVAITGYGRDQDRILSAEAGIDHHLVKPVVTKVLAGLLSG